MWQTPDDFPFFLESEVGNTSIPDYPLKMNESHKSNFKKGEKATYINYRQRYTYSVSQVCSTLKKFFQNFVTLSLERRKNSSNCLKNELPEVQKKKKKRENELWLRYVSHA